MKRIDNRQRGSRKKGFSLTEFMVGISLAGLLFAGAISTVTVGFRFFAEAKDQQRVTQILKHETDSLRLLSWDHLTSAGKDVSFAVDPAVGMKDGDRFMVRRLLTEKRPGQYEVELTVEWQDAFGRFRERSTWTLFTRNGLNASYGS